jgi:hypothetical protein
VRDEVLRVTANKQEPFVYGSLGGATVSVVPATAPKSAEPPAPPVSAGPGSDMRRGYEYAERVGTRTAWKAFLTAHPDGFYANLARAQLAKLGPAAIDSASRAEPPKVQERDNAARDNALREQRDALRRQEDGRRAKAEADRQKLELEATAKAEADRQQREWDAAARTESEQLRLEREAALKAYDERSRLEREAPLKAQSVPRRPKRPASAAGSGSPAFAPSRERNEVLRFERELACERLRPQVVM